MSDNYFDKLLDEGYELITKRKPDWPSDLNNDQLIELINALIHHYSTKEDYQKCNKLQKKLMKLKN